MHCSLTRSPIQGAFFPTFSPISLAVAECRPRQDKLKSIKIVIIIRRATTWIRIQMVTKVIEEEEEEEQNCKKGKKRADFAVLSVHAAIFLRGRKFWKVPCFDVYCAKAAVAAVSQRVLSEPDYMAPQLMYARLRYTYLLVLGGRARHEVC